MASMKKQRTLLSSLRSELSREDLSAFIVGSGDAHQSEYVCKSDMRRQFITGFTGSSGTALILQDKALLWTDGRYFLQCEMELSDDWTLMKSGQPGVLEINDWLLANMSHGQTVGIDASLMPTNSVKKMIAVLKNAGVNVKASKTNPVDTVWNAEGSRPASPCGTVKIHDITLAGVEYKKKIETLQDRIHKANATSMVISMLDEVPAYLTAIVLILCPSLICLIPHHSKFSLRLLGSSISAVPTLRTTQ
jgi:Xaa-Pro aminopeptidase